MTRFSILGLAGAAMLTVASPAFAHPALVRSNPVADATVRTAPRTITLAFDRRLNATSSFEVIMPGHGGMKVPVRTTVSPDGKRLVGTVQNPLIKGAYKVVWTVAGADGHKVTGEIAFQVG